MQLLRTTTRLRASVLDIGIQVPGFMTSDLDSRLRTQSSEYSGRGRGRRPSYSPSTRSSSPHRLWLSKSGALRQGWSLPWAEICRMSLFINILGRAEVRGLRPLRNVPVLVRDRMWDSPLHPSGRIRHHWTISILEGTH